ncbi:MAG TPA: SDR family NAD(P)-dependent oxidoreductase, partial [Chthonomonadales bacterium]|nr:SDR family NAD(P)-dependent oxidoreductase [Chthonomonadales bacterium]
NAAKFAVTAVTRALRLELVGRPIRITEVAPGMVETEFSQVRFGNDTARAAKVYAGLTPLSAEDVAECVRWAVSLPAHVNIDEIVVKPTAQASVSVAARQPGPSS